jgi:Tol biopolymer transport system component
LPGWNSPPQECCGTWSPDGKYYFFQATVANTQNIWVIPETRSIFHKSTPVPLTTGPLRFQTPVPDVDGKKLFVIGEQPRVELVRYDIKTKQFVPFLLGISAGEVDVSRDGQWVTYVTYPGSTLWRSKIDGSERLQLTFSPVQAHLPRSSPDGTRIVFNDTQPGKPWKVLVVSSSGGSARDLLQSSAGATDPTWFPDGNSIVFTSGFGTGTTSIEQIDLTTNQITKLPGSDTLFSARVSRNGHYVAAFSSDAKKLMLYNFATKTWSELAQGGFGFENWSHDDKYIYVWDVSQVDREELVRVNVADRKLERLFNLNEVPQRTDLWAQWTGLAAEDADPEIPILREAKAEYAKQQ